MATSSQRTNRLISPRKKYSPPKPLGPSLKDLGKLLPRRYEETKTVNIQALSHKSILDIGKSIEEHTKEKNHRLVKETVDSTEQKVWEKANEIKRQELQEVLEAAALEKERALATAKESEKRALARETQKIKDEMQESMYNRLEQQRIQAEARLKMEIMSTLKNEEQLRKQAFNEGRIFERALAEKEARETSRQYEQRRQADVRKYTKAKFEAMQNLATKMNKEKEEALVKLRQGFIVEIEDKISTVNKEHQEEIGKLERVIDAYKSRCSELRQQLRHHYTLKILSDKKLEDVIKEFQQFIEMQPTFQKGQAEYLIKIL
ncbi:Uncharacterized protein C6orf163-like protein [Trichoplax sp. H2]|nr:Uncharacterized protein C6orf163-like protein [Trichoplax sp. H2]|eukprot:RDD41647.1 Uncharacterized protein C6orf163-like protein [Trichoplax sp. H2]